MSTRHPTILEQLSSLLPPGGRRGATRLDEDLSLTGRARFRFAEEIERAWAIAVGERSIAGWTTLDDVCATIADGLEMEAA